MDLKGEFEKKPGNEVHEYPTRPYKTRDNNEAQSLENMENLCLFLSIIVVLVTLPLSLLFIFKMAYQYERVVILRLGKVRKGGPRGPGLYLYLPCVDDSTKLDLRTLVFQLDPQQVLTKDSCTIQMDVIIFCRIEDPIKTVIAVSDLRVATLNLASTILRNIIGQKDLTEFLSQKDAVALALKRVLDAGTYPWGVKVLRVEIMGIRLPTNMQRAMASEAEATREAKAKMIFAEGELLASKALNEASDIMIDNPVTIHLRYLQTLMVVSADKNSTIIFPLPTDLLKKYVKPFMSEGSTERRRKSVRFSFSEVLSVEAGLEDDEENLPQIEEDSNN